jgi:hypothetical protein
VNLLPKRKTKRSKAPAETDREVIAIIIRHQSDPDAAAELIYDYMHIALLGRTPPP